jgi:hypothetical protein
LAPLSHDLNSASTGAICDNIGFDVKFCINVTHPRVLPERLLARLDTSRGTLLSDLHLATRSMPWLCVRRFNLKPCAQRDDACWCQRFDVAPRACSRLPLWTDEKNRSQSQDDATTAAARNHLCFPQQQLQQQRSCMSVIVRSVRISCIQRQTLRMKA